MDIPANEEIKTTIENNVSWFVADKLSNASVVIATKKYLTNTNLLVYLTACTVAEPNVPRFKVQVLQRVSGGVHETMYHLYADHRLEKSENEMVFGESSAQTADGSQIQTVSQVEAEQVVNLLATLTDGARVIL